MAYLEKSLAAWDTPNFESALKAELPTLGNDLPLQEGLSAGSFAVADSVEVMILSSSANKESIQIKVELLYKSLMPGCACAGDPTVEDTQNEHMTVFVSINRETAEASFQSLET